jgi:hypothetical protein
MMLRTPVPAPIKHRPALPHLPGDLLLDRILTEEEYAAFDNVSVDTIRRRNARGEGAPRIQLSPKRHGYCLRAILAARKQNQEAS